MGKWNASLAWASSAGMAVVGAIGLVGCSSSSSSSGEGGSDATTFDALPPLGVGEPNCTPDACPAPGTCAGTLLGPNSPVTYCTIVCAGNSDCPKGNVCTQLGLGQCLPTCTTSSDCSGGFGCADGGYCFSLYNGADAVPDAEAADGGQDKDDAGSNNEAGATEAGGQDAGGDGSSPDAGADGPAE